MSRTAIVVDDNATMRSLSRRVLETLGFTVAEAEDGRAALEWCEAHPVSLVLTDLRMPLMDGLELIQNLRRLEGYARVPILVITTEDRPSVLDAGREAGASGWLVKPFTRYQLVDILRELAAR